MSSSAADPKALQALANQADGPTLEYFVSCVSDLLTRLTRTAIKRTDGEMCLLKMCLRHQSMEAKPVQMAPAAPVAAPAAKPQPKPAPAPAPVADDGPPPFSDMDMPPWETDSFEQAPPEMVPAPAAPQPAPTPAPAPAPAPVRSEAPVRTAAPQRSAAPVSGGDPAVKDAFLAVAASRVSGAVRTYLKLADMEVVGGVLHIACREESMIFMKKPAVQEVLNEAAQACGYQEARIRKMGDPIPGGAPAPQPKAADPMADILARAKMLGVEVK